MASRYGQPVGAGRLIARSRSGYRPDGAEHVQGRREEVDVSTGSRTAGVGKPTPVRRAAAWF
jgi:hypothetical protein